MAEANTHNSALETFPHIDLTNSAADGLVIPMQNDELFTQMHEAGHVKNILFTMGHTAVAHTAGEALEDKSRVESLLMGCEIYEIISTVVRSEDYDDTVARLKVYETTRRMIDPTNIEWFTDRATYAAQRLTRDAPKLFETIKEIAEKRLAHDGTAVDYAIAGAGIMRGMQIRTDRQLAA